MIALRFGLSCCRWHFSGLCNLSFSNWPASSRLHYHEGEVVELPVGRELRTFVLHRAYKKSSLNYLIVAVPLFRIPITAPFLARTVRKPRGSTSSFLLAIFWRFRWQRGPSHPFGVRDGTSLKNGCKEAQLASDEIPDRC